MFEKTMKIVYETVALLIWFKCHFKASHLRMHLIPNLVISDKENNHNQGCPKTNERSQQEWK